MISKYEAAYAEKAVTDYIRIQEAAGLLHQLSGVPWRTVCDGALGLILGDPKEAVAETRRLAGDYSTLGVFERDFVSQAADELEDAVPLIREGAQQVMDRLVAEPDLSPAVATLTTGHTDVTVLPYSAVERMSPERLAAVAAKAGFEASVSVLWDSHKPQTQGMPSGSGAGVSLRHDTLVGIMPTVLWKVTARTGKRPAGE